MMKKTISVFFAFLCVAMQGAWAQTSDNWTYSDYYSTSWTHTENDGKTIYIDSEADLARLAVMVNSENQDDYKDGYAGYTFKLTKDLNLSAHYWEPIGNNDHRFEAVFDGQGHTISGITVNRPENDYNGLFGFLHSDDKAGIYNLKLINSSIKGRYYNGGIAGYVNGNVTISNVICNAAVEGYSRVGGIVGTSWGVTKGVTNLAPTIKDCLYNGSSVTQRSTEYSYVGPIVGDPHEDSKFQNNYYTMPMQSGVIDDHTGAKHIESAYQLIVSGLSKDVKMNWIDTPGVLVGNTLYVPDGAKMRMGPYGYSGDNIMPEKSITAVKFNGTPIERNADCLYRHTFNAATESEATIEVVSASLSTEGDGTEAQPYQIQFETQWNALAMSVTNGGNSYAGKYFKLTSNVNASTMVGMSSSPFSGNFSGGLDTYTLTLNYGTASEPFTEGYCAPFRYVDGATIHGLKVGGEIYTSSLRAAGIVAKVVGNSDITGCRSSVTINSTVNGEGYHGGFVSIVDAGLNITGCRFDGKILGANTTSCGGFVGSRESPDATLTIKGCLFDPTEISVGSNCKTFANTTGNLNITNSYYLTAMGEVQGACPYEVHNIPANRGTSDDTKKYSASGFQVWDNALCFNYDSSLNDDYYYVSSIGLYDGSDGTNAPLLTEFADKTVSLTLWGRTLYKDGSWNTLYLPFNIGQADITTAGHILYGAEIRSIASSSFDESTGVLTIDFSETNEIKAGIPYIVRWQGGGSNIVNPVFDGVTVSEPEAATTTTACVDFIGLYERQNIYQEGDKTNLYLGAENTLYYPTNTDFSVNAFRGYFQLKNGLRASQSSGSSNVRAFNLSFSDDEPTGIEKLSIVNGEPQACQSMVNGSWYDLSGRRLNGKPTTHGIYINNGKKVVIK